MKIKLEKLTITYNRYLHFKSPEDASKFAKILLDKGHYFAFLKKYHMDAC